MQLHPPLLSQLFLRTCSLHLCLSQSDPNTVHSAEARTVVQASRTVAALFKQDSAKTKSAPLLPHLTLVSQCKLCLSCIWSAC